MLNVDDTAGAMGQTGWDLARAALVGRNSLFDVELETGTVADYVTSGSRCSAMTCRARSGCSCSTAPA